MWIPLSAGTNTMNIYHRYHHNLILSDSTVIGPLTQWLAIVALKVCCPLACSSKQPTNKILSPAERWTEKASREEKDKNVIVKDDGVDRGKGTSVWRLPSSFLPLYCFPSSISPMALKHEWQVSPLWLPSLLICLRAVWPSGRFGEQTAQLLLFISFKQLSCSVSQSHHLGWFEIAVGLKPVQSREHLWPVDWELSAVTIIDFFILCYERNLCFFC